MSPDSRGAFPTNYHWAFCHSYTSLALLMNLREEPPEIGTLCIWAVVFHGREADLFSSAQVALHERRVELRRERVGGRGDIDKARVSKMRLKSSWAPVKALIKSGEVCVYFTLLSGNPFRPSNDLNVLLVRGFFERQVRRYNFERCRVILDPLQISTRF